MCSIGLHTNLSAADLAVLLQHAQARTVICDARLLNRLAGVADSLRVLCIDSAEWRAVIDNSDWAPIRLAMSKSEIRSLMYTSGSTGVPKATITVDNDRNVEFVKMAFWRPPVTFAFQPLSYMTERLIF